METIARNPCFQEEHRVEAGGQTGLLTGCSQPTRKHIFLRRSGLSTSDRLAEIPQGYAAPVFVLRDDIDDVLGSYFFWIRGVPRRARGA
jgi:hypothetical protein